MKTPRFYLLLILAAFGCKHAKAAGDSAQSKHNVRIGFSLMSQFYLPTRMEHSSGNLEKPIPIPFIGVRGSADLYFRISDQKDIVVSAQVAIIPCLHKVPFYYSPGSNAYEEKLTIIRYSPPYFTLPLSLRHKSEAGNRFFYAGLNLNYMLPITRTFIYYAPTHSSGNTDGYRITVINQIRKPLKPGIQTGLEWNFVKKKGRIIMGCELMIVPYALARGGYRYFHNQVSNNYSTGFFYMNASNLGFKMSYVFR